MMAQLPADLEAVLPGEHHVQEDQVERALAPPGDGRLTVRGDLHVVAFQPEIAL
jgi:hypothetical protein